MDEFLNELYGTSEIINGDDLEKQAAAEFLVKLAEQEGVDLDTLSDDEVGALLSEIEGGMGKQASETETDGAQEKLAEADFLGRAMAHAYVNELNEIEKEAAGVKELATKGYRALGRAGRTAGEWTGASDVISGARGKLLARKIRGEGAKKMKGSMSSGRAQELFRTSRELGGEASQALSQGAKRLAKRVGAPAAAGATLYGAGTGTELSWPHRLASGEKKSFNVEFEDMARERAYEMLAEAGYAIEKVAQQDVDTLALQMLEQSGYPVQWGR